MYNFGNLLSLIAENPIITVSWESENKIDSIDKKDYAKNFMKTDLIGLEVIEIDFENKIITLSDQ